MFIAEADHPVCAAEAERLFSDLGAVPSLVLAVSGGPDSTALLLMAAQWRAARRTGPKLVAVTVDHGLRPESSREAAAVKRCATKLGVAHRTMRWTGPKPSTGLQEAARNARYRLLAAAARKARARHILTAHTRDDQAETVLFRLMRGSGLTGLSGMARTSALNGLVLVRPLLGLPKSRLIATLKVANLPFIEDPSNRDPRFTRARLRELMPRLAAEGLTAPRLARLATRVARAEAALEAAAEEAFARLSRNTRAKDGSLAFEAHAFFALPEEIALRLLGRATEENGDEGPLELSKLESLLDALRAAFGREDGSPARCRRTLAGALITLDSGKLAVERAPKRRKQPFSPP